MHFFHCPSSQDQYIRRHDHIWDAIIDQIGDTIRREDPYDNEVEHEPLVRAHLPPPLDSSLASSPQRGKYGSRGGQHRCLYVSQRAATSSRISKRCSVPTGPRCPSGTRANATNIADKAARQCRGDIGVYTDGSRLLVDVAVGKATAPSYRKPPLPSDEPPDPQADASETASTPPPSR